jgi:uncharacterized membrane protein
MTTPPGQALGARMPPSPGGVRATVGRVLRVGTVVSAATVVAGYVVGFIASQPHFGRYGLDRVQINARGGFAHSLVALGRGVSQGKGEAIIAAGVLLVVLTPVAGVVTSAVAFVRRGDRVFGAIAVGVVAVIFGSFLIGWVVS